MSPLKQARIKEIYDLSYESFELAMDIIRDWRIDRYYASKVKLLDLSLQLRSRHP